MANTFGILAALVLAFAAFVAHKNKVEHQTQINNTKTEGAKRDRNTNTFNTLVADITALGEDTEATNTARDDFQAKLKLQNDENKTVEETITTKETELKETKARVAEAKDTLDRLGDLKSLAPKIEALKSGIAQLEDDVKNLEAQNSLLHGQKTATTESSNNLSKILSDRNSGRSLATLKTSVANISDQLGFVTLAAGDNAGVVSGSKLDVKRNGEVVAQLTVTAVSANTATADIIASSVKEGDSVSIGDSVVAAAEDAK